MDRLLPRRNNMSILTPHQWNQFRKLRTTVQIFLAYNGMYGNFKSET